MQRAMFCLALFFLSDFIEGGLFLRDRLSTAPVNSYVVTAHRNHYTLLHVRENSNISFVVEEVTVPASRVQERQFSWKSWFRQNAPGYTSWLIYRINMQTGQLLETFSVPAQCRITAPPGENYFTTLLNLEFHPLPPKARKTITYVTEKGTAGSQVPWQPRCIVEGKTIPDVKFETWGAVWPSDGSELANKAIEIYLPADQNTYPSYFPYWLQIKSSFQKAVIRVIDSGNDLSEERQRDKDQEVDY